MIFTQRLTELSVASFEPPDTRMGNDFEKKIPRTAKEGFKKIEKNLSHAKKEYTCPKWGSNPQCLNQRS